MNNLEWLYENDRDALADFAECDECETCRALDYCHGEHHDRGWLMAEHVGATCDNSGENVTHDSREKLEAEILDAGCADEIDYDRIIGWLDRQVAITERKHLELTCAFQLESDKRIIELQAKVDELTEQLEAAHEKNRALKVHIGKMQAGRHGWHVKGVELEKENAELQAAYDELTAQLRASNAERERLRECLGIATDNAHDLLTLVDESGNVYDRDEGLA